MASKQTGPEVFQRESTKKLRAIVVVSRTSYPQNQQQKEKNAARNQATYEFIKQHVHPALPGHVCSASSTSSSCSTTNTSTADSESASSFCALGADYIPINLSRYKPEDNLSLLSGARPEISSLQEILDDYEAEPSAPTNHIILAIYGKTGLTTNMHGFRDFFRPYKDITITLAILEPAAPPQTTTKYTFRTYHVHKLILATWQTGMGKYNMLLWDMALIGIERKERTDWLGTNAWRHRLPPPSLQWQVERDIQRALAAQFWHEYKEMMLTDYTTEEGGETDWDIDEDSEWE